VRIEKKNGATVLAPRVDLLRDSAITWFSFIGEFWPRSLWAATERGLLPAEGGLGIPCHPSSTGGRHLVSVERGWVVAAVVGWRADRGRL